MGEEALHVARIVTVGLAGGSGSGKGHLSEALGSFGIPSFDCDAIYHSMIESDSPVSRELVAEFGERIRKENGGIDRPRLADLIFAPGGESKRARLNEITHRHILCECRSWLERCAASGKRAAMIDAPLLFESGFDRLCDLTVAVIAPPEIRIERICRRDGIEADSAKRRIAAQISDEELMTRADLVFWNDGDSKAFSEQIKNLIKKIEEMSQ